ncbi:MAG: GNAT family N-acetyltransferase, partial [Actinomycetota bacterium]
MIRDVRLTDRLRLEPIGPRHARDLWRLHQDDAVAEWYDGKWTTEHAECRAIEMGAAWESDAVNKWMAYDRETFDLIGRGGLSRKIVEGREHLEVGWAVRGGLWDRGYGTEIDRAGLAFAFNDLGADEVIAFTEVHNARSRAVM